MVALDAVDRAAHRIDHEAPRHRLALDARVELERGIERSLARAVGNELERPKEPAPADIADERVLPKALLEAPLKAPAHCDHVGEKASRRMTSWTASAAAAAIG